jgi:hypothetical protein
LAADVELGRIEFPLYVHDRFGIISDVQPEVRSVRAAADAS